LRFYEFAKVFLGHSDKVYNSIGGGGFMKSYTKEELKALNFPAKFINKFSKSGTRTVGIHGPSGARMSANEYAAWSLARAIGRDQATLDGFLALAERRGFTLDSIFGLRDCIRSQAMSSALAFEGIKYNYPD